MDLGSTVLFVLFMGIAVCYFFRTTTQDPYGLFHLSLNTLPGETIPATEWLNMGYWKDTNVFPRACEALATKLIHSAKCQKGDRILGTWLSFHPLHCKLNVTLDVGHGTGESLILLLSGPSVPRPSAITGITSLPTHSLRSEERITRLRSSEKNPLPVRLYQGDAVCNEAVIDKHPLSPSSTALFDRILALDCAYHFETREAFLCQSLQKLAPGGRIALADICFDPQNLQFPHVSIMASISRLIPRYNFISTEGYIDLMKDIGFTNVELEDITSNVFPGFTKFLKSRGVAWSVFAWVIERYAAAGARFVVVGGAAPVL